MRGMTKRSGNRQQRDRNALHPRVRRLAAGVGLVFAAALILAAMPPSVAATPIVVVLRPMANSSLIEWSKSGGGGKNFDRVDEATSDGDATYVYTSRAAFDVYALQDLSFAGTIDFVRLKAVARLSSGICQVGTVVYPGCFTMGITIDGPSWYQNRFVLNSTYATYSHTYTVNPWTGQAWTVAQVNALKGIINQNDGESTVRVTQFWAEVQFTPTG